MASTNPLMLAWAAVRRTWRPVLLIQLTALTFAVVYALSPTVQGSLEGVARLRDAGGLPFAAISTVLASVLLPEIATRLTRAPSELVSFRVAALYVFLFGLMGVLAFSLQGLLGQIVGPGTDLGTIVRKVALDQLGYSPLISIPISTTAFLFRDAGFSWTRLLERFRSGDWTRSYVQTLVTCWAFWTPTLLAVYGVPVSLQFALFLLIQAAWSLLIIALNAQELRPVEAAP